MKRLENLKWKPMWVTHLGAVKGCLEYLNVDVSDAWLFGATGHAFLINMHELVCPSSPTAWNTEMLFKLGANIGYSVRRVWASKRDDDFAEKQKLAWEQTKKAIDNGLPCYGWELAIPEYYVVSGYDDVGYYFNGPLCDGKRGAKPWRELASTGIGVLEMCAVRSAQPVDDITAVKEALAFAVDQSSYPDKWTYASYKSGLAAYDLWIQALRNETALGVGVAYNAAVWAECRTEAVQFLAEAKNRLDGKCGDLFDLAIQDYERVAADLESIVLGWIVAGCYLYATARPQVIDRKVYLRCIDHPHVNDIRS